MKTTNWEEITLHKEKEEREEESENGKQKSEGKVHHCENKNRYLHVIYYIKTEKNFAEHGEIE